MKYYNQRAQEIYDLSADSSSLEKREMIEELCDLLSNIDFKYTNLLLKTKSNFSKSNWQALINSGYYEDKY